ncbi:MAG: hypothetical protein J3K34DRAFT_98109 [Monoraphidium minutum]|nr:MAG: hypothetical protein J3K34DRAFT_98109 [Monoraphidium minutum]
MHAFPRRPAPTRRRAGPSPPSAPTAEAPRAGEGRWPCCVYLRIPRTPYCQLSLSRNAPPPLCLSNCPHVRTGAAAAAPRPPARAGERSGALHAARPRGPRSLVFTQTPPLHQSLTRPNPAFRFCSRPPLRPNSASARLAPGCTPAAAPCGGRFARLHTRTQAASRPRQDGGALAALCGAARPAGTGAGPAQRATCRVQMGHVLIG